MCTKKSLSLAPCEVPQVISVTKAALPCPPARGPMRKSQTRGDDSSECTSAPRGARGPQQEDCTRLGQSERHPGGVVPAEGPGGRIQVS